MKPVHAFSMRTRAFMDCAFSLLNELPLRVLAFTAALTASSVPAFAAQGLGNISQNAVSQNASGLKVLINFLAVFVGTIFVLLGVVGLIKHSKGRSQEGIKGPMAEIIGGVVLIGFTFWITSLLFTTTGGSVSNVPGLQ